MKCINCDTGYYLLEGTTNCYKIEEKPPYSLFDTQRQIFRNCSTNCLECEGNQEYCKSCRVNGNLDPYSHKCSYSCSNPNYLKFDKNNNQNFCVDNCGNYYFPDNHGSYYYHSSYSRQCVNCAELNQ